ncbi:MerR family transcriptional regulator [Streptomyces sp. NPDC005803]|uniref:MerR family transcriptional regulator n=1 Tax=Streptomyces sp. NPDC005803 TaxID=3154297 RepID=UPI0033D954E3
MAWTWEWIRHTHRSWTPFAARTAAQGQRRPAQRQVADAAGVNIQTLRYYERRGPLSEPERSHGGHGLHSEDAVTALRVIKAAQRFGCTLEEVAELLEAGRHRNGRPVAGLQERATAKSPRSTRRSPTSLPSALPSPQPSRRAAMI